MSGFKRVRVCVQGMGLDFVPNGSYDVVDVGWMGLDEALGLFESRMPRVYSEEMLDRFDLEDDCPATLIFEDERYILNVSLSEDGSYYVIVNDKFSSDSFNEFYGLGVDGVKELVLKYMGSRGDDVVVFDTSPRLVLRRGFLNNVSLDSIRSVVVRRPGFLSGARIIVDYLDEGSGRVVRAVFSVRDKRMVEDYYRILLSVLGEGRVSLK